MCTVTTVVGNNKQKALYEKSNLYSGIARLIAEWDARKYHIFPAFRRFGYLNATLAESGNSTLK